MGKNKRQPDAPIPPPQPARPRPIHLAGPIRDVVFAVRADGSHPAKVFLESLSNSDQVKFLALFMQMTEHGKILSNERFRFEVGKVKCTLDGQTNEIKIAEFKIHSGSGQRILAYLYGRQWVLTNGFAKGENLSSQIQKANQIVCEDLEGQKAA